MMRFQLKWKKNKRIDSLVVKNFLKEIKFLKSLINDNYHSGEMFKKTMAIQKKSQPVNVVV